MYFPMCSVQYSSQVLVCGAARLSSVKTASSFWSRRAILDLIT
jgi:hypothetical protein